MLYLGIDLHLKQMTVSLRNEMATSFFAARSARAGRNWRSFVNNCIKPWPPTRNTWRSSRSAAFTTGW